MSIETRLLHLERSLKSAQGSVNQRRFSIFGQGTLIMHQTSLDVDVSARTSNILTRINALETQIADLEERVVELESGLQEKIVITFSNSPYSVSSNNVILFCFFF